MKGTDVTMNKRTRVLVVDDHSIVRRGLQQVLEESGDFEVVGLAADGREAVHLAAETSPDVILMDVTMPGMDGVEACREIMSSSPDAKVAMLTASTEEEAILNAVAAGATGYIKKETTLESLLSAVRDVAAGELRVPASVVTRVFAELRDDGDRTDPVQAAGLTPREQEILTSFAMGMSYAHIAQARGIKPVTVRNAIYGIQSKLNIRTMQGLVLWAVRNDLLDEEVPGP